MSLPSKSPFSKDDTSSLQQKIDSVLSMQREATKVGKLSRVLRDLDERAANARNDYEGAKTETEKIAILLRFLGEAEEELYEATR